MKENYRDAIAEASEILMGAMLENSAALIAEGRQLDGSVRTIVSHPGLLLVRNIFLALQKKLVEDAKAQGFTVERRPVVTFETVFGPIELTSVYL